LVIWVEICISKSSRFDGHGTVYGLKERGDSVAAAVVAPSGSWRLIGSLTSFRTRKEGVLMPPTGEPGERAVEAKFEAASNPRLSVSNGFRNRWHLILKETWKSEIRAVLIPISLAH
jgi:hypothetical protein